MLTVIQDEIRHASALQGGHAMMTVTYRDESRCTICGYTVSRLDIVRAKGPWEWTLCPGWHVMLLGGPTDLDGRVFNVPEPSPFIEARAAWSWDEDFKKQVPTWHLVGKEREPAFDSHRRIGYRRAERDVEEPWFWSYEAVRP